MGVSGAAASTGSTATSALHLAAASGDLFVLQNALKSGARLTEEDAQGCQPLHCAAMACCIDAVRFLVRHGGVDANARSKQQVRVCLMVPWFLQDLQSSLPAYTLSSRNTYACRQE
jgi:ankyrin repeat protein